jgi:putative endonuclease
MTNDLERRFKAHQRGKGAWFTRVFGVEKIVYSEEQPSKSDAFKRERAIKKLTRAEKLRLIA